MIALPLALALLIAPAAAPPPAIASPALASPHRDSPVSEAASRAVPPLAPLQVVAGFDPPDAAYGAGHRGVDLAGEPGQAVLAPLAGTVTTAGLIAGMPVVVIDHHGQRTTYQPVRVSVALGTAVAAGDPIGVLAAGGSHCAPAACLHWGLKQGQEYLDPLSLLGPRPVRLLPPD